MTRFILYAIVIYLLYLGLKTFLNKFNYFKKFTDDVKKKPDKSSFSKKDVNNIEDADFEEIKKP